MLKQLRKSLESEKNDNSIFDIVVYGSAVKGKAAANDVDLAVIFLEGTLRERLDKVQSIKKKLKSFDRVDIKQLLLKDLFSTEFLARTGILLEGISLFKNKKFSELIGFESYTLFWYDLKGLSHTEKVKFNYLLAGRGTMKGMIEELKGERLANGAVKIIIENSLEFEEVLKKNSVSY